MRVVFMSLVSVVVWAASNKPSTNVLLKADNALAFLRTKRSATDQLLSECCNTRCSFEERAEVSTSWANIDIIFCELSIREGRSCRCTARGGSYTYECGSDLSGCGGNPCSSNLFNCGNGRQCASFNQQCDSNNNCGNWLDETTCAKTRFTETEIQNNMRLTYSNQVSRYYGIVEIFGRPICDNAWTNENAKVVCKTLNLGHPDLLAIGWRNEQVSPNFFMDYVSCGGNENNLRQCTHRTYHSCGSANGAAVICLNPTKLKIEPFNTNVQSFGMVVLDETPICATGFNINAAQVVCNHLYGNEFKARLVNSQTSFLQKNSPLYIESVVCNGAENLLTKCTMRVAKSCTGGIANVECIQCSPTKLMNTVQNLKLNSSVSEAYQSVELAINELTKKCSSWICNVPNPVYPEYCKVKAFLNNLRHFAKTEKNNNIAYLNTDVNYLGMLNHNFLKQNFEYIQNSIDTLGIKLTTQLGNYFTKLAEFDEKTANSDKENALSIWSESKSKCEEVSSKFSHMLTDIVQYALDVAIPDLVSKVAVLVARIVGAFNPIKLITAGDDVLFDIKEAFSEIAKQAVRIKQVEYLSSNSIPKLENLVKKISANVNANKDTFKSISNFLKKVEKINEVERFSEEELKKFLEHADTYSPSISSSDISQYESILNHMIDKLCEVIENPETEAGTISSGIAAHKGICPNAKETFPLVIALYQDILTQETNIMDGFSKFVRATIAKDAARKLSTSITGSISDQLQKLLIQYEALHLIRYHNIIIIKKACNYLTYMNHGVENLACTDLLENPSGDPGTLINTVKYPMCNCPNCVINVKEFLIPATMTGENETVDLSTLYHAGNQSTKGFAFLNFPNKDWLVENRLISDFEQGPFFLKKLNIHLPPALNFSHEVNIKITLSDVIKLREKSYVFEKGVSITNQYTENALNCNNLNPYTIRSCSYETGTFCLNVDGIINGDLLPRLDGSKWRLDLQSNLILPKIYSSTKIYLQAKAEFCYQTKAQNHPNTNRVKSNKFNQYNINNCCSNKGMYADQILLKKFPYLDSCQVCPAESTPRLHGYFCEKCPPGFEPNTVDSFGCTPCSKNKFKSIAGQQACYNCPEGKISEVGSQYCYSKI